MDAACIPHEEVPAPMICGDKHRRHLLPFEEVEHTADKALRVYGHNLQELIENACRGTIWLLVDNTALVATQSVNLHVEAAGPEQLIVRLLKELLYLVDDRQAVPVGVDAVQLDERQMQAACGVGVVPLSEARPYLRSAIKAVTYHDLHITRCGGLLSIVVTFDT